MKVKELKRALAGAPDDMEVAMADGMSVVFAEVEEDAFIVSDLKEGMDDPVKYWRDAD